MKFLEGVPTGLGVFPMKFHDFWRWELVGKNSWTDGGSVLILQHGLGLYARGVVLSSLSALSVVLVP